MTMSNGQAVPQYAKITRWIARIWTIPVFALTLMIAFGQDSTVSDPGAVPAVDWFLLGFWVVAVLGLALAWRWERAGGALTIAVMFLRELAWIILKGGWVINFLIFWALVAPPAVLFLVARALGKSSKKT
jgi:hypothetical protein